MTLPLEKKHIPLTMTPEGVIRVARTRVTLDTVMTAFKSGSTTEDVVDSYPSLTLADVHTVLSYYGRHQAEVEAYLAKRHVQREATRRESEARFGNGRELKERLLARLQG
jgi:uncharacterized protein (DUF433 family)